MGKVRNIFAIDVGRYTNAANIQRVNFQKAKSIWDEAMHVIAAA
jgi:putative transposase